MNDQREMEAAMRTIPHTFTGILAGTPDRPCTTCGLPDRALIHTVIHQRETYKRALEDIAAFDEHEGAHIAVQRIKQRARRALGVDE